MLARVAGSSRRLARVPALQAQLPAATTLISRRTPIFAASDDRAVAPDAPRSLSTKAFTRDLSSKAALSKMGTLSVDPLGGSSAVQGAEYVLAGFDSLVNWARKSSMWPMTFGLA